MSKVKIEGNASGTGTLTISAPNTNTDRSLTLPDGAGEILLANGDGSNLTGITTGKVLQVVQNTYSTSTSVGGASYTDTGLSATITPSSTSSKVLVLVHQPMTHLVDTNSDRLNLTRLVRGSTVILSSRTLTQHEGATNRAIDSTYMGHTYLDSPATTSATTYKTQFYIDGTSSDLYAQWGGGTSTMILMEIAG